MKLQFFLYFFSVFIFANAYSAEKNFTPIKVTPKVIYGIDDRLDIYETSNSFMKELARSTAAQIPNFNFIETNDTFILKGRPLGDLGVCYTENYANQMAAANCSGFLVAPDVLVTAGHCIEEENECANHAWFFDYANTKEEKKFFSFTANQVAHCTQIIAREKDPITMNDYAVLKLDHPILDRAPLKFRLSGKPADDAVFTVIGHPTGLPTKITSNAEMRDNSHETYFRTNSDTFGGNSGSPVIDSKTGLVEGILVRGNQDFVILGNTSDSDESEQCLIAANRDQTDGAEDAIRITVVNGLPKK